jgi:argininosuccinate lyase
MKHSLWGDGSGLDSAMAAYTAGDDRRWDQRLLRWDIIGTMGHIGGLAGAGLLTLEEHATLAAELDQTLTAADAGLFRVTEDDEDAHTALEQRLVGRLGELGEKVHTGRSRNDQVMAALRLYLKSAILEIETALIATSRSLLSFGGRHAGVVMPGFTHTRRAMPSSVGLWAAGYAEVLLDNLGLLDAAYNLADRGPLGSAAGYGTPLPLDRLAVSDSLGFASPQLAVTSVQLSRGKLEATVLSALWAVARDLAALSWDVVLFSADEYGYFVLPAELATGSSIMPQKRNPDVFELTRGRAGIIAGLAAQAMAVAGSLPGGYHRDMQLTKGPLMEGLDTVHAMLVMMADAVPRLGVDAEVCAAAVGGDLLATDEVYRRVRDGVPFRTAYRQVAAEIKEGGEVPELAADAILEARTHLGGAGAPALDELEAVAMEASRSVDRRQLAFSNAIARTNVNRRDEP